MLACMVALLLALPMGVGGCSETNEVKLERAKLAVNNRRPDEAVRLAEDVLREEPDNIEAREVLVRGYMLRGRPAEAQAPLERLIELAPDDPAIRDLAVSWAVFHSSQILRRSDFVTSEATQALFDESLGLAYHHADQLAGFEDRKAGAAYIRARIAELDQARHEILLEAQADRLQFAERGGNAEQAQNLQVGVDERRRRIDTISEQIEGYLSAAIAVNPGYFAAHDMKLRQLQARQAWSDIYQYASELTDVEDLPASLAEGVVSALLLMPEAVRESGVRISLAEQVQGQVAEEQRDSRAWRTSQARLLLARRQPAEAEAVLTEVLKTAGNDVDVRYLMARSLSDQEKFEPARRILDRLVTDTANAPQVLTLHGQVLVRLGEPELARESLRRAVDLNPDDPQAQEAWIMLLSQEGQAGAIADQINEYFAKDPTDPNRIERKLRYDQARGDLTSMRRVLERTEAIEPHLLAHLAQLTQGYAYLRQYDKMLTYAQRLAERRPDDPQIQFTLARAMLANGMRDEARALVEAIIDQFDLEQSPERAFAALMINANQLAEGIRSLQDQLAREPNDPMVIMLLANAYAQNGDYNLAIQTAGDMLAQDPHHIGAHELSARLHQAMGRPDRANYHLDQIDSDQVTESNRPALLAQIKFRAGDRSEAIAICNRAIADGRGDAALRLLLAQMYEQVDDLARAEEQYLALVREQPTSPQAYFLITRFYIQHRRFEQGALNLRGLQAFSEPLARLSQSSLLSAQNRYDDALAMLQPILPPLIRQRDPLAWTIAQGMVNIHTERGDLESAARVYQPMIEAGLFDARARLAVIDLLWDRLDRPELLERLETLAGEQASDQLALRKEILDRLVRARAFDEALRRLATWLQEPDAHPAMHLWRGETLVAAGRPLDGVEAYQEGIEISPDSFVLRRRIAEAYASAGDFPSAETAYLALAELGGPARTVAAASLALMFDQIGLNQQAARSYDMLDPAQEQRDPETLFTMGSVLKRTGRLEDAWRRFVTIQPNADYYAAAQLQAADVERHLGRRNEARDRLRNMIVDVWLVRPMVDQLLRLNLLNEDDLLLLTWADESMNIDLLDVRRRVNWLRLRVSLMSQRGDLPAVLNALTTLDRLMPGQLPVLAGQVLLQRELGQPARALAIYREHQALQQSPLGSLLAVVLDQPVRASDALTPLGRYVAALARRDADAALEQVSLMSPMHTMFQQDLAAMVDMARSDPDRGRKIARELAAAMTAYQMGMVDLGVSICNDLLVDTPNAPLASSLLAQGMLNRARKLGELSPRLEQHAPSSVIARYIKAREHSENGRHAEAAATMKQVLDAEPGNVHVHYLTTQLMYRAGEYDQAIALLEPLVEDESIYQSAAQNDLAYILAETRPDRMDEAHALASRAVERSPRSGATHDTLGWIEYLRDDPESARVHLTKAVTALGAMPEVQYHMGQVYRALGNDTWARYYLEQAASGPTDVNEVIRAQDAITELAGASASGAAD